MNINYEASRIVGIILTANLPTNLLYTTGGLVPAASLPVATAGALGAVKKGAGVLVAGDGTLTPDGSVVGLLAGTNAWLGVNTFSGGVVLTGATAGTVVESAKVAGDSSNRLAIGADGKVNWGGGLTATDTTLYRASVATLKTDGNLTALGTVTAGSTLSSFNTPFAAINTGTGSTGYQMQLADSGSNLHTAGQIVSGKTGAWTNGTPASQTSYMAFMVNGTGGSLVEGMRLTKNLALLVGTTVDNGTDVLQVSGSATIGGNINTTGTLVAGYVQISNNSLYMGSAGVLKFLTPGGTPQDMIGKSLVLSDVLTDSANALLNGLYAKGGITTLGALSANSATITNALSAGSLLLSGFTFNNGQLTQTLGSNQTAHILVNTSTAANSSTGMTINLYDTASASIIAAGITGLKVGAFTSGTPASYVSAITFNTVNGSSASAERMRLNGSNLLLGSTADNGTDRLQVSGSILTTTGLTVGGILKTGTGVTAITNAAGNVLASALAGLVPTANLPIATTASPGVVKADGVTILVAGDGTLSAASGAAAAGAPGSLASVTTVKPASLNEVTASGNQTGFGYNCVASGTKIYRQYNTVFEAYDTVAKTWATLANLPNIANGAILATIANGNILAMGGDDAGATPAVYLYDVTATTWSAKTSMPVANKFFGAATVGSKVYTFGGTAGGTRVDRYDVTGNTWTANATAIPTSRTGQPVCVAVGTSIYVLGGGTTVIDVYDTVGGTWSTAPAMPIARTTPFAWTVNSKLYVVGGDTATVPTQQLDILDIAGGTWSIGDPCRTPYGDCFGAYVGGVAYLMEGKIRGTMDAAAAFSDFYQQALDTYNVTTALWTSPVRLPFYMAGGFRVEAAHLGTKTYLLKLDNTSANPRLAVYDHSTKLWSFTAGSNYPAYSEGSMVACNGKIYRVGGENGGGTYYRTVDIYNPLNDTWTAGTAYPDVSGVSRAAIVATGTTFHVVGGLNASILDHHYIYDTTNNSWSSGANLAQPTYWPAIALLPNGVDFILACGHGASGVVNTVVRYNGVANTYTARTVFPGAIQACRGATLNGLVYVLQGNDGGTIGDYANIQVFNDTANTWTFVAATPGGRDNPGVVVADNLIYSFGGTPTSLGAQDEPRLCHTFIADVAPVTATGNGLVMNYAGTTIKNSASGVSGAMVPVKTGDTVLPIAALNAWGAINRVDQLVFA